MESNVLVTVLCVSYNHASNISKAIESFLGQRTSFEYEIIVHDDASTDETPNILHEYEKRNIANLTIIFEKENQYSKGNITGVLNDIVRNKAQGRYIAICEGDDYWIDCNKLQIQADYMENNPQCTLTAHNGLWIDNVTHDVSPANGFVCEKNLTVNDLIRHKRGCFPTASMMCRKEYYEVKKPFPQGDGGAWIIQLYCRDKGTVHYFDRIMCVYNVNFPGSWTLRTMQNYEAKVDLGLRKIEFLDELNKYWKNQYVREIQNAIETYAMLVIDSLAEMEENKDGMKQLLMEHADGQYSCAKAIVLSQLEKKEQDELELKAFMKEYSSIYVMGCGKIATQLVNKITELEESVDGFVVSNNQMAPISFLDLPVYKLSDIGARRDVGIVVGIQKSIRSEVIESLEANGIQNYLWPSI